MMVRTGILHEINNGIAAGFETTTDNVNTPITLSTKKGAKKALCLITNDLSWSEQEEMREKVYPLFIKNLYVGDTEESRKDVIQHILGTKEVCIVPSEGVPEGLSFLALLKGGVDAFVSYNFFLWKGEKIIYFSCVVVCPDLHGFNYGSLLIQEIMRKYGIDLAVLRTQSPIMYMSFAKACKAFPSFDGIETPKKLQDVGEFVAREALGMTRYNEKEMTEIGTYGRSLYTEEPIAEDPEIDRAFKQRVNIDRGDSMIVVGTLKEGII